MAQTSWDQDMQTRGLRALRALVQQAMKEDLSLHQLAGFVAIAEGNGSVSEIAGRIDQSVPAMTRIVNALASRGFVNRRNDPSDARLVIVSITPKGNRTLSRILSAAERGGEK